MIYNKIYKGFGVFATLGESSLGYIEESTIREVNRIPIEKVVEDYVHLQRKGTKSPVGLCPFHTEKTPSFTVSPRLNLYNCFGCDAGGNAVKFIMEIENMRFPEAVKLLCERHGVPFRVTKRFEKQLSKEKRLYGLFKDAAIFYHNNLINGQREDQKKALDYVLSRVSEGTIKEWRLGYASGEGLYHYLVKEKNHSLDLAIEARLLNKSKFNYGGYDFFRDRIIFPINDGFGKPVALAGRVLDDSPVKYINSNESMIYKKSRTLYGLDKARKSIRKTGKAVVVEGYFDVLKCFDNGLLNSVGACGTALNSQHLDELERNVDEITICFDSDKAGRAATERSGITALLKGIPLKVVDLGEGDPEEFIGANGIEEFKKTLEKGISFIEYAIDANGVKKTDDSIKKFNAMRDLYKLVDSSRNPLQRYLWLGEMANILKIDMNTIKKDYAHHLRNVRNRLPIDDRKRLEEWVLGYIAVEPLKRREAKEIFRKEDFSKPEYQLFFQFICSENMTDDVVIRPELSMDKDSLYYSAERKNLIEAFKKECRSMNVKLHEDQYSNLEGVLMNSVNRNAHVLTLFRKEILAKELREIEEELKENNKRDVIPLVEIYQETLKEYQGMG